MTDVERLIDLAKKQVGNEAYEYRKWYYGQDIKGVAWCAIFVSWLFAKAGIDMVRTDGAGCFAREGTPEYGTWYESEFSSSSTTPKVGDIVTFVWNYAGRYQEQDRYYSDHVGIVYAVDDDYIYTIEGNSGVSNDTSTVKFRLYARKSGAINGYFRPKYTGKETEDSEMNFKKGDKSDGVLAYKALLMLANDYNIINAKVDNSNSFGQGTYDATIAVQKYFNLEVDGIAGKQTISALSSMLHGKAVTSTKGHNKVIDDLGKKLKEMKI